jgi:hypothetical protein
MIGHQVHLKIVISKEVEKKSKNGGAVDVLTFQYKCTNVTHCANCCIYLRPGTKIESKFNLANPGGAYSVHLQTVRF